MIKQNGRAKSRGVLWLCRCDCGQQVTVQSRNLISGGSQSCGCLQRELLSKRVKTHGMTDTPLYKVWKSMKNRCYNPNDSHYHCYGGRGITVCDEWKDDFQEFYNWAIEHGYCKGLSVDRINNDGNYCPENCRWITLNEQMQNTSKNVYLTYNGRTLCISEWSKVTNIHVETLRSRIKMGWDTESILTKPPRKLTRRK